jgi:DNA-binding PadR family transcriptional regulator
VPLAHTILAVLMDAPAHGYAIKKQLAAAMPDGAALNDGQLYPTLARMERRGWIRKQIVEQPRHPSRHCYRLSAAGKRAFYDWLAGEHAAAPDVDSFRKSDFLQRCAFFRYLGEAERAEQIRAQQAAVERSLAWLEPLAERLADCGGDPHRAMVVEYGIRVQRLRHEWLAELLAQEAPRERRRRGLGGAQRVQGEANV